MVGELFSITKMTYVTVRTEKEVFVPMVGELFSMRCLFSVSEHKTLKGFRPHGWGAFFNTQTGFVGIEPSGFRPHGWGAFFNPVPEMCDPVWLLHAICGGDDTT